MTLIAAATAIVFLFPAVRAHREAESSGSLLQVAESTGLRMASAAEAAFFEGVHNRLVECQGVQDNGLSTSSDSQAKANLVHSAKKMEDCLKAITSFAEVTKNQRDKSMQANKNYAADLVLAHKILRYLTKQTETHEQNFNEFRGSQEQHLKEVQEMLTSVQQEHGPLAQNFYRQNTPGSLIQAPTTGYQAQAMPSPPWANMEAMFAPGGQNFGVPGGLVGRRPSLLQVGPESPGSEGGSLQARLDSEAERLAEADEAGPGRLDDDPDA